ncbi:uncharacterized protein LOC135224632 isoform X4 [Macrobrachium nipponense]|uniref:uncharacterized protein LOC135224632 isoform X4 n=1 Tax=Macrobrachium nipponense TaxID=159736 RepID=UPI0030C881C1
MILLLIFLAISQVLGQVANLPEPEDCVSTPLSELIVKTFQDVTVLGFGPLSNSSRISLSGNLIGQKSKSQYMSVELDLQKSRVITFYLDDYLSWLRTADWDLLQLEVIQKKEVEIGQSPYELLVTAGNETKTFLSSLEPPMKIKIDRRDASEAVQVFFNCPAECRINQDGLDKVAGRTTFYLWREEEFNGVEVHPEGLQVVRVLPEQVPDLHHWYKIDVQGNLQSIRILVDSVPLPLIPIPVIVPHFTDMRVTVNGSAKVSWCPQHYRQRPDPGHRTAAALLLIVLIFFNILVLSFRTKLNLEIKKIQKSRSSLPAVAFRNMPLLLAEHDCPPPAPPPLTRQVTVDENYVEPNDSLSKDYVYLDGDTFATDTEKDEYRQDSTSDETFHGNHLDGAIGKNGLEVSAKANVENENTEEPYDLPVYLRKCPIDEGPYSTRIHGNA